MKGPIEFVAFGDTHLKSTDAFNDDRLTAWDQVVDYGASRKRLAAWFHCGDVFHEKSTIDDRLAAAERLQRMATIAPVVVSYGNHCAPKDLDLFARLKTKWPIHVVARPDVVDLTLATGDDASVFVLPYPQKSGLVALGVPPDEVATAAASALDVLFVDAADRLTRARTDGRRALMIGHANIGGSKASTGQPLIGPEINVSAAHLSHLGPIVKLFGHIHLPQDIGGATYVGSGCRLSYGETEAKRFVVAHVAADSSFDLESIALDCPPRYHVDGSLTRDGFGWCVTKGPDGPADEPPTRNGVIDWTGCDVRVRCRYPSEERDVLTGAKAAARDLFAGARRFDFEPIAVSVRAVRAPEVAAATTLPDKLRAWSRTMKVDWTADVDRCAAELVTTDDFDALVAAVEARLGPLAGLQDAAAAEADVKDVTTELLF